MRHVQAAGRHGRSGGGAVAAFQNAGDVLRTDFALRFTAMLTLGFSLCEFVYRLLRAVIVGTFSASLWLPMLVALVASTVAGYFALQYLKYLLHREKLRVFSYYCWDAAVIALILALINA